MSLPEYIENLPKGGFLCPMTAQLPKTALDLKQISQEEGIPEVELSRIFFSLPIGDNEEITYLEAANQCIIDISNLVDTTYPDLNQIQKVATKLRLMGKLLSLKAQQLLQPISN